MLRKIGEVSLPSHSTGGFDHADVHSQSGKLFVAHTANGTVEVVDGERLVHLKTIPGCPEASGVICAQDEGLVFAASRGSGKVLVLDALQDTVIRDVPTGPRPNGLAWDSLRKHLLVADVEDNRARIFDTHSGMELGALQLRGRPRWCAYDRTSDAFLVNIREPAGLCIFDPRSMSQAAFIPVSSPGPHGLDIAQGEGRAYIACDGKSLVVLDFIQRKEVASIPIAGGPDAIWYNPKKRRLYCAIGDPGVVDVLDTGRLTLVEQLKTEVGAHTVAFDNLRQRLFVFLPTSCRALVFEEE